MPMNRVKERHRGICSWALEDRPREKLLIKGREVLSDAELLAIIMRSGTSSLNAVDLAKKFSTVPAMTYTNWPDYPLTTL